MDTNEWEPSGDTLTWGDFDRLDAWVKAMKAKLLDAEDRFNRSQISYKMLEQQLAEVTAMLDRHWCQHGTACVSSRDEKVWKRGSPQ